MTALRKAHCSIQRLLLLGYGEELKKQRAAFAEMLNSRGATLANDYIADLLIYFCISRRFLRGPSRTRVKQTAFRHASQAQ